MGGPVKVHLDGRGVALEDVACAHASLDDGTWRDIAFHLPEGGGSDITLELVPLR